MSIANEITRLQTAKADLKTAIMAKGVEVADTDTIDTYASKVDAIESGGVEHSDYINPEWTDWRYFCQYRDSIAKKLKYNDTSNGTNFAYMFDGCRNLITIPELDISNGTNFNCMFYGCSNLTSIPKLNTSKGIKFFAMFNNCSSLTTIPELNTSNGTDFAYMFDGCRNLTSITFVGVIPVSISFSSSPLTLESAINVITHLKNYLGLENEFKYIVTFSATTWDYLDAEGNASPNGNSWREYINDLGWNAS